MNPLQEVQILTGLPPIGPFFSRPFMNVPESVPATETIKMRSGQKQDSLSFEGVGIWRRWNGLPSRRQSSTDHFPYFRRRRVLLSTCTLPAQFFRAFKGLPGGFG